ncbi:DUF2244 domain-containing protein [Oceanicella actignis]|uniref:DUF2244 domain-containing protein n=1 Tax=Oceanicella actignis TaxID=1189325 RepID=UPI0011E7339A|nr:DUF2244 domain-containing protein [Oceanicella actignis]TYO85247.1 putative membrane protein [Oceanicella actignis]
MARQSPIHAAAGDSPAVRRQDPPLYEARLWPNRSLSSRGFRWVMGGAAAMMALPFIPLAGTPVAAGLAPFALGALALLWLMIRRNYRDGRLTETLRLWPDVIEVERREPDGRVLRWSANPYWVKLRLHPEGRPENYLTLEGGGRVIELGAFLSPEERVALAAQIEDALARARRAQPR